MKVSELFLEIFPDVLTVICNKCEGYISHEDFPDFDPVDLDKCPHCGAVNIISEEL